MGFRIGTLECLLRVDELRRFLASHPAALTMSAIWAFSSCSSWDFHLARPRSVRSSSVFRSCAQVASQPARLVHLMRVLRVLRVLPVPLVRLMHLMRVLCVLRVLPARLGALDAHVAR